MGVRVGRWVVARRSYFLFLGSALATLTLMLHKAELSHETSPGFAPVSLIKEPARFAALTLPQQPAHERTEVYQGNAPLSPATAVYGSALGVMDFNAPYPPMSGSFPLRGPGDRKVAQECFRHSQGYAYLLHLRKTGGSSMRKFFDRIIIAKPGTRAYVTEVRPDTTHFLTLAYV